MRRANTSAILADANVSTVIAPDGKKWIRIKAASPRALHQFRMQHANTSNERSWFNSPSWSGLIGQTFRQFDETGINQHARDAVNKAQAALPDKQSRPNQMRPAVTGAVWNVPAVLANIPLAAQTRVRTKIAPIDIKISLSYSAMIDESEITPRVAKLAKAIWDYTMRGGAVTLTVFNSCRFARNYRGKENTEFEGAFTETRVNAADVAGLSLALSPGFFRGVAGPLCTAASDTPGDCLYPAKTPLPGIIEASGIAREIHAALDKAIAALNVG